MGHFISSRDRKIALATKEVAARSSQDALSSLAPLLYDKVGMKELDPDRYLQ